MNHLKIIVPFYNVEKWILYNIRSIKKQEYKNYECILVNDHCTDNTVDIIEKEIEGNDNFNLYTNVEKTGALGSTSYGIDKCAPNNENIIIILDGDDWFPNESVLGYLNDVYEKEKCWMTYGSYVEYPSGNRGKFSKQIPQEIIDKRLHRETEWVTSHLRTFKYKLWKQIKKEDLKNKEGKFYEMAGDLPVVFPMLEMCGDKSHYIKEAIHVYNRSNPLNEDKVDHQLQYSIDREVRTKQKYKLLEEL